MLKDNESKKSVIKKLYNVASVVMAFFSAVILWYWNVSPGWGEGYNGYLTLTLVGVLYSITYWFFAKMYQASKIGLYRLTELAFFQFLSYGLSDVVLFVESVMWFHGFKRLNIFSYIIVFVVQIFLIVTIIFVCNRIHARYDAPRKVMIVYGDENYVSFVNKLNSKKYRYEITYCFSDEEDIEQIKAAIDECFSVYLYDVNQKMKKDLVLYCKVAEKNIYITQDIEDLIVRGFEVSHTFDTPFVRTKKVPVKWYYPVIKRVMDFILALIGLIVLSPLLLVVACLIKLYDGGPVFYKQVRLTKGHREFEIYKFRSMIVDAEKRGAQLSTVNDDRITPVGKFIRATRVDELPQLINILNGDMSIIGPRPERPEIEEEYIKELPEFSLRLEVPAGLSGYAQVFGKYNTNPSDKLKLDLLYINQRSLLMDLKLILYTIKVLFIPESTEGVMDTENQENDSEIAE